jgi:hypothetical protein
MPAVARSVFRMLIWLYPPGFRREFASEMSCDFSEATREAWIDGRWRAVVPLWAHLYRDLTVTIAGQWLRTGLPVVPLLSAMGMTMFLFALTRLLSQPMELSSLSALDRDRAILLFLATMVILLAAAVIVFTVGLSSRVLRRPGRIRRV